MSDGHDARWIDGADEALPRLTSFLDKLRKGLDGGVSAVEVRLSFGSLRQEKAISTHRLEIEQPSADLAETIVSIALADAEVPASWEGRMRRYAVHGTDVFNAPKRCVFHLYSEVFEEEMDSLQPPASSQIENGRPDQPDLIALLHKMADVELRKLKHQQHREASRDRWIEETFKQILPQLLPLVLPKLGGVAIGASTINPLGPLVELFNGLTPKQIRQLSEVLTPNQLGLLADLRAFAMDLKGASSGKTNGHPPTKTRGTVVDFADEKEKRT